MSRNKETKPISLLKRYNMSRLLLRKSKPRPMRRKLRLMLRKMLLRPSPKSVELLWKKLSQLSEKQKEPYNVSRRTTLVR
jgi:hypothetical protein